MSGGGWSTVSVNCVSVLIADATHTHKMRDRVVYFHLHVRGAPIIFDSVDLLLTPKPCGAAP